MHSAFHLDDSFACADTVVAVLEVEAEEHMGSMLEEDIADGAIDNGVDRQSLCKTHIGSAL